ncbi:mediator of RNA polymerase II transcription subunit 25-like [Daphnia pulicaria]|uniref:mediator of RNA polymerase II transcription subunit 25-like n=1 Tax=Daphnia pulicaria TaxID=35523 RepID=UPI001EEBF43B|nr:mediator of RNA polymerase II transcription subunit 25-like [Daphnia pulicaria]
MDVPRIQIKEEKEKDDGFISLKDIEICNRLIVKPEIHENERKTEKKQEAKENREKPEVKEPRRIADKKYREKPEVKEPRRIADKKYREKPEVKEQRRIADKKYREKPEVKEQKRIANKKNREKPEVKEQRRIAKKKYREKPEVKEQRRIAKKKYREKPEVKEQRRIADKKNREKQEAKENMQEQHQLQQINVPVAAVPEIIQQQAAPVAGAAPANPARERQVIWQGVLEWQEKTRDPQILRHVPCQVSATVTNGESEVKAEHWPQKLLMQLIPKTLISHFGFAHFRNARSVMFHPQECEALESLAQMMSTGYAGCVYFKDVVNPNSSEIEVLLLYSLFYSPDKEAYIGFIPNDQAAFLDQFQKFIIQQKSKQVQQPPGPGQAGQNPNIPKQGGQNLMVIHFAKSKFKTKYRC